MGVGIGVKESQWSLLTLKGISQAISIGNRLAATKEDFSEYKFIASSCARTQHTLRIILEILGLNSVKLEIEPLISSKNKGIFEDVPKEEIRKLYPGEIEKKKLDHWNYRAPGGGESLDDLYQKISQFVNKHGDSKNMVVALHDTGCGVLSGILQGKTREEAQKLILGQNQNYFISWDGNKIGIL
jgi:broad specificity phosphatase PhoE